MMFWFNYIKIYNMGCSIKSAAKLRSFVIRCESQIMYIFLSVSYISFVTLTLTLSIRSAVAIFSLSNAFWSFCHVLRIQWTSYQLCHTLAVFVVRIEWTKCLLRWLVKVKHVHRVVCFWWLVLVILFCGFYCWFLSGGCFGGYIQSSHFLQHNKS